MVVLNHFMSSGDDQYITINVDTCSTGPTFWFFDLSTESCKKQAPTVLVILSGKKTRLVAQIFKVIHIYKISITYYLSIFFYICKMNTTYALSKFYTKHSSLYASYYFTRTPFPTIFFLSRSALFVDEGTDEDEE